MMPRQMKVYLQLLLDTKTLTHPSTVNPELALNMLCRKIPHYYRWLAVDIPTGKGWVYVLKPEMRKDTSGIYDRVVLDARPLPPPLDPALFVGYFHESCKGMLVYLGDDDD